ncbi:MAG: hypothetical protein H6733_12205 [Alphaproteobacteria bacterium]|nr:hypothetical protein [Alphaproteobacteria bacterium]
MSTVHDPHDDDALRTIDTRPMAQPGNNRPDDGPLVAAQEQRSSAWQERAHRLGRLVRTTAAPAPQRTPAAELAVQVASVFVYAMLGAVAFRAAMWWMTGA